MIMSLPALAIDLLLPAFPDIRMAFDLAPDANVAPTITTFFFGLAAGMLIYGTLSDRFGRKPVLFAGFAIYALGGVGAALAPSFDLLLLSRFAWGFGAASPRILTLTIVRDLYDGEAMARVMSFVMAVFIMVPAFAPGIGRGIILVAPWRFVFWFCVVFVIALAAWTTRLPETLAPENRIRIDRTDIARSVRTVLGTRETVGFTLVMMFAFGAFTSFLGSSEIIVREIYDLEAWFPLIFGSAAGLMGVVLLVNANLVERLGTRRIGHLATVGYLVGAMLLFAVATAGAGAPPLWALLVGLAAVFVPFALLIPNLNTLAMHPVGHVAGTASAFIGFVSTAGGAFIGSLIDRAYDGTVRPLATGYLAMGVIAVIALLATERGRLRLTADGTR